MTLLLNTSIKVTLIVLVALAATAVLRRRSAGVRHFVLAAALACAAAIPALRAVAPAWQAGMGAWLNESRLQLIDQPLLVLHSTTFLSREAGAPSNADPRTSHRVEFRISGLENPEQRLTDADLEVRLNGEVDV